MNSLDFIEIAVGAEYFDALNFSDLGIEKQVLDIELDSIVQPDANKIVIIR
ncbi:hypothetical protein [Legionella longbeachae]|uniref:hypothetical protein n=1 Tax=Legionella longbeachae TaxID=450 RepID=UPI000F6C7A04|nr:hypothetical protein [Legionella longbeachae]UAK46062.1 hypothetical protein K8O86_14995 [Legionella longbeachae]VEE03034.1 Uncharacterised protein [Legionella oakridgensis]HCD9500978.1 hypothetical protein [Legionella pneumophila]